MLDGKIIKKVKYWKLFKIMMGNPNMVPEENETRLCFGAGQELLKVIAAP
jgi:hypothetical protein